MIDKEQRAKDKLILKMRKKNIGLPRLECKKCNMSYGKGVTLREVDGDYYCEDCMRMVLMNRRR